MGKKLLVTNLPPAIDAAGLEDMFTLVGDVRKAMVDSDRASGVGHVEMRTEQEAQNCIDHFNGQSKFGYRLVVREDKPHLPNTVAAAASPIRGPESKMRLDTRCPNMNHGRMNAPVKFCPSCGEVVNRSAVGRCSEVSHSKLRKNRHAFCHDCGKRIS